MESFTGTVPISWTTTTPGLISQETGQGRVHSGNSSVRLLNGSDLSQTVAAVTPGCYYQLSFNADGDGAQVGLTAKVVFETTTGDVPDGSIVIRQQDIPNSLRAFNFYQIITSAAPANVTGARIEFFVTVSGNQALLLDDVSFAVQ